MENIGLIILLVTMIHAYVFGFLFFSYKRYSNKIIGVYLFNFAIQNFLFLNIHLFEIEKFYPVYYIVIPFLGLLGHPLIYLYVKSLTSDLIIKKKEFFFHALPAILSLVFTAFFFINMPQEKREQLYNRELVESNQNEPILILFILATIFLFIQVIFYGIKMFKRLYAHDQNVEKVYSYKENLSLKWLKVFIAIYVFYYIYEFYMVAFKGMELSNSIHYALVSLHIFFVAFMAYKQREIFKKEPEFIGEEIPQIVTSSDNFKKNINELISPTNTIKEESLTDDKKNSISQFVSEEKKSDILAKLNKLMEKDKIYLDQNLNLYDLSKKLNINKTYLSYIINEGTEANFYNYVNKYRIEEAKKMLKDNKYDHLSIEGIAKNAGFKNRSSFYPVFKKVVGQTPTDFKNSY